MLFDYAVGNPPYQYKIDDIHNIPVYHEYYKHTEVISACFALITPARFLMGGGYTPKEWNSYMTASPLYKVFYYAENSDSIFPNTQIKGGVAIVYYNDKKTFTPIGLFTPYPLMNSILAKVNTVSKVFMDGIVYPQTKIDYEKVYKDYPTIKNRRPLSHRTDKALGSNAYDAFKELFADSVDKEHTVGIYGLSHSKRTIKYMDNAYLADNDNLEYYKVVLPKASGKGSFGEKLAYIDILPPMTGHTFSFRSIGKFQTLENAINLKKYLHTKFARVLMSTRKTTQDITPRVFKGLPLENFSNNGDIDWTLSIEDIDKQLYKKYNLSLKEIDFINTHVEDMPYKK